MMRLLAVWVCCGGLAWGECGWPAVPGTEAALVHLGATVACDGSSMNVAVASACGGVESSLWGGSWGQAGSVTVAAELLVPTLGGSASVSVVGAGSNQTVSVVTGGEYDLGVLAAGPGSGLLPSCRWTQVERYSGVEDMAGFWRGFYGYAVLWVGAFCIRLVRSSVVNHYGADV